MDWGDPQYGARVTLSDDRFPDLLVEVTFSPSAALVGFAVSRRSAMNDRRSLHRTRSDIGGKHKAPPREPNGGLELTARLLRSLPVGEMTAYARQVMLSNAELLSRHQSGAARGAHWKKALAEVPRPGRRGRPDLFYAQIAAMYVDELPSSKRPVAAVAEELKYSADTVSGWLDEARRRRLLTRPPKSNGRRSGGRAAGQLTANAIRLLKEN